MDGIQAAKLPPSVIVLKTVSIGAAMVWEE
jgi:hypothetical protein